ncbi:penicillin-binding protein 1C [Chondromyces apiculatus]|uniref:peptidoglycan glycosyltransferase n=1 Tax=Chondromyces apiculatus DSM 436 TaxID=1192034 RepID=A0A017TGB8_9BACT|nr:penicillin-binding protein 1C [Chondromyces apiculatus]EYF08343.1 Multimodular transpeptidase-transglycosylase [Chondromyces apiculatus DSM 436]
MRSTTSLRSFLPRIPCRLSRPAALAALATVCLATSGAVAWSAYRGAAGEPSERLADTWHAGRLVLDRNGHPLREIPSDAGHRGQSAPLDALGERILLATLASEDRGFFEHEGIDPVAILRALGQNLRHGRLVSGASTITQQLVKLLDAGGAQRPRTLGIKIEEAARAQNLERIVDKRTLLQAYLDRLGYGHGLTGPEAAARGYFGVAASELSWAQAAYLAVLPRAPTALDPYQHPERVLLRQRALLDALHAHGLMPAADHARAVAEEVTPRLLARPFHAPHFVQALLDDGAVAPSGPTTTTLDLDLQRDVEGLTRTHLAALADLGASSAAVLVVDTARGEVLAHVGSADFHDPRNAGQVDLTRARRQPGSALKPFVYALAFAAGHTSAEPLPDVPTSFPEPGGTYAPGNFDGTFEGPISAREALAGSLNIPAVRLAAEIGPAPLLDTLHHLGFASLTRDAGHYGLSLALGSGEVTLHELAEAYTTLARGGRRLPLTRLLAASASPASPASEGEPVLEPAAAALVMEALSDPLARIRGLHGRGPFDLGFPVAVKTGTSSGYRDTWAIGATRERTVAVWLGNPDGSPTRALTGASGAGPLFADVMKRAMADVSTRAPLWEASLLQEATVCPLSGALPGPDCPDRATRRFAHDHLPHETCSFHVRAQATPAGPRVSPTGVQVIVALPETYAGWLSSRPRGAPGQDPMGLPWYARGEVGGAAAVAAATHTAVPELRLDSPAPGTVFVRSQRSDADAQVVHLAASLAGEASAGSRVSEVEFVVDGVVAARSRPPFRAALPATPGDHLVLVRPTNPTLPVQSALTRFSVR